MFLHELIYPEYLLGCPERLEQPNYTGSSGLRLQEFPEFPENKKCRCRNFRKVRSVLFSCLHWIGMVEYMECISPLPIIKPELKGFVRPSPVLEHETIDLLS